MVKSFHVSIGTVATPIATGPGTVHLSSEDPCGALYLGGSDVTMVTGFPFTSSRATQFSLGGVDTLFGIVPSGTVQLSVLLL